MGRYFPHLMSCFLHHSFYINWPVCWVMNMLNTSQEKPTKDHHSFHSLFNDDVFHWIHRNSDKFCKLGPWNLTAAEIYCNSHEPIWCPCVSGSSSVFILKSQWWWTGWSSSIFLMKNVECQMSEWGWKYPRVFCTNEIHHLDQLHYGPS